MLIKRFKKQNNKNKDFFGTLRASLLGNLLAGEVVIRAGEGGRRTIITSQNI